MIDEESRQEASGGDVANTTLVNPFRCRMWSLHDRLDEYLTEQSCKSEIESISRHGQLVPVLARSLHNDPNHDMELIFGARRLFVARHLNMLLRVQLRKLSDREALVAMDAENRHRKDISPYERGMSYARWLNAGHFGSQEEIARALGVSASQVSRLLKLARLPTVIVAAFPSAIDILEAWGIELSDAWERHELRPLLARTARLIAAKPERPSAKEVYEKLMSVAIGSRPVRAMKHDEVVVGDSGTPLFRIRRLRRAVVLSLPVTVSTLTFEHIRKSVADILQDTNRFA
jgi:ParB family transcriptional regulator, chromosome partitioning protein